MTGCIGYAGNIGTGAMGATGMVGCIGTWGCTGTGTMAGCGGAGATCALPMGPPRLWPQLTQNLVPSALLAPHSVQKTIALGSRSVQHNEAAGTEKLMVWSGAQQPRRARAARSVTKVVGGRPAEHAVVIYTAVLPHGCT